MKRLFVIFNPAARGEKSRRLLRFLESKAGNAVTLAPTRHPGDASALAAQAAKDGYDMIVAAGGDGTINEVVNGMGCSGIPLGILPLGTINVFALDLGIPLELEAAWSLLETGTARAIDLGCAEFAGKERFFVQLAGVGFDAHAVRAASWELKKRIGFLSYIWAGVVVLLKPRTDVEVRPLDGQPPATGSIVLIGNGRLYGGKLALFPHAKLDDGKLDVCVFERWSGWHITRYVWGILRGKHVGLSDVKYIQTDRFECRTTRPAPFELDGEDAGEAPVTFSVLPRALRVVTPIVDGGNSHA